MKYPVIILFLFLASNSTYAQNADTRKKQKRPQIPESYQVGEKVDDFQLKNVDEKTMSLSSITGTNGCIIIFTSNTCPFAVAYEDRIIELHNKMATKGYPIIAINSNDPTIEPGDAFDDMIIKHTEMSFPFVYLKDDNSVFVKFGAKKTPEVFLLDEDMILQYTGAIDDNANDPSAVTVNYVENAIAALENGDTPELPITKAIGCSIKVKGAKKGGRRPKGPPSVDHILERMDVDKDMRISKEEAKGPLAADFEKLDVNHDGLLSKEELLNIQKIKK